MSKKIRVAQYGCGKMSVYTMRYVYEKGAEIVAAFDIDENKFGKDISTIMGGEEKGVKIANAKDAEAILKEAKPDICIITTMSLFSDVYDAYEICAKLGINAISTCEEAFYPMNSNPTLTKKLDELAKKNNCTLTGAGYQDVYWGNLITVLAGSTHKITKIKGLSHCLKMVSHHHHRMMRINLMHLHLPQRQYHQNRNHLRMDYLHYSLL